MSTITKREFRDLRAEYVQQMKHYRNTEAAADELPSVDARIASVEAEVAELTDEIGDSGPAPVSRAVTSIQRPAVEIKEPYVEMGCLFTFNQAPTSLGVLERLAVDCFDAAIESGRNIRVLVSHQDRWELASLDSGNLLIESGEHGVRVTFSLLDVDHNLGCIVGNLLKRGKLRGCSPCLGPGVVDRMMRSGGREWREIVSCPGLVEFSLTGSPAYPSYAHMRGGQNFNGVCLPGWSDCKRQASSLIDEILDADLP